MARRPARPRVPGANMQKQFLIVSYDVSDDKRRRKVMKQMENFGRRVQFSVFECELRAEQIVTLKGRLAPLVKEKEDSIRFYFLPEDAVAKIETMGDGGVTRDPLVYITRKTTVKSS
jgi:CRISPR-associated protein Cas2